MRDPTYAPYGTTTRSPKRPIGHDSARFSGHSRLLVLYHRAVHKPLRILLAIALFAWAPSARAHTAFVQLFDHWRFQASGQNLGTAWHDPGFDDSAWSDGAAPIGDGPGFTFATHLGSLPSTTYFRHGFTLDVAPASVNGMTFEVAYAQGFVAYLNGHEVARRGMPVGPVDFNTPATGNTPMAFELVDLSAAAQYLVSGNNVLAVELHETSPKSPLLVWAADLTFTTTELHVVRGPFLETAAPDAITVSWRTSVPTTGTLKVGTSPSALAMMASDSTSATQHEVRISGLQPGTKYFYSIGTPTADLTTADDAHSFTTPPTVGTAVPTRIWVLGDAGTQDDTQRAVRDAYYGFTGTRGTDLWLLLGDNAYGEGTDPQYQYAVFENMYEATLTRAPVWPTVGNHDWLPTNDYAYLGVFALPKNAEAGGVPSGTEEYYSFDYGNAHFVTLDTDLFDQFADPTLLPVMKTWLAQDLAGTQQRWLIAFFHHPPYSKGTHDSDTDGLCDAVRRDILPMLEGAGVDLVLTGHSHDYERSILLDGLYQPSPFFTANPTMFTVDGGDGRKTGTGAYQKPAMRTPHKGTVYVTAGDSGSRGEGVTIPLDHPANVTLTDPHSGKTARGLDVSGSLVLDLADGTLDAHYIDYAGMELDSFTIQKGPLPPTGAGGASSTGTGTGTGGGAASGGAGGAGNGASSDGGCGCRVSEGVGSAREVALILGLAAMGVRRRRRAR